MAQTAFQGDIASDFGRGFGLEDVFEAHASPAMLASLHCWGSVVAHRAGCIARVTLTPGAASRAGHFRRRGRRMPIGPADVERINPTVWQLARDWHGVTRNERSYPSSVRPLTNKEGALRLVTAPGTKTRMETVKLITPASAVVTGFLHICTLFRGGNEETGFYVRTPLRMQSLLCWLFAVPIYAGYHADGERPVSDLQEWLRGQRGGRSDTASVADVLAELRRWLRGVGGLSRDLERADPEEYQTLESLMLGQTCPLSGRLVPDGAYGEEIDLRELYRRFQVHQKKS